MEYTSIQMQSTMGYRSQVTLILTALVFRAGSAKIMSGVAFSHAWIPSLYMQQNLLHCKIVVAACMCRLGILGIFSLVIRISKQFHHYLELNYLALSTEPHDVIII